MRIGIFGGSFNPPHQMHRKIGESLLQKDYLDKVIYVPTGNHYRKKDLIDAKHRYQMVFLMIEDNPFLEVSDYELKNKLMYTYQTLDYFKKQYPNDEIYFICGDDNLKEITTWKHYEYILAHYKVLVIRRGENIKDVLSQINTKHIIFSDLEKSNLSSTLIRTNLSLENFHLLNQLDKKVLSYIKDNHLYNKKK